MSEPASATNPKPQRGSFTEACFGRFLPVFLLGLAVTTYIVVFGVLTWNQHTNFGTFGFDMGIYDQGIWLLSQFENPFITVRGLHYFGHHANFSTFLLVPLYWLGGGPRCLYLVETVMLAAGAVPIWLIGRRLLNNAWIALAPAIAYLLYPSLEWINWWHFHPDALIITPLLFAWWFAHIERWRWFIAAVILALMAKEDAAIAVAAMGVLVAIRTGFWLQRNFSEKKQGIPPRKQIYTKRVLHGQEEGSNGRFGHHCSRYCLVDGVHKTHNSAL